MTKGIPVGNIPPRTRVSVRVIGCRSAEGLEIKQVTKDYYCLDCSFNTSNFYEMMEHQFSFKHSPLTRLKRWFIFKIYPGARVKLESLRRSNGNEGSFMEN